MEIFYTCGFRAVIRTSWTNQNPGRRFWCCPLPIQNGHSFYGWYDPEMCPRSVEIIPGLLRKINTLEGSLALAVKYASRMRMLLLLTWTIVAVMVWMSLFK